MNPKYDLTGQRFGCLTVVRQNGISKHHQQLWLCRCDCGKETTVNTGGLKSGNTKSCGCLKHTKRISTNGSTSMTGIAEICNNDGKIFYSAYTFFDGREVHLGFFDNLEKAKEARAVAEERQREEKQFRKRLQSLNKGQKDVIKEAQAKGLNKEQIDLICNPQFDRLQMDELLMAFENGLTMDQVSDMADPRLDWFAMHEKRMEFQEDKTWNKETS